MPIARSPSGFRRGLDLTRHDRAQLTYVLWPRGCFACKVGTTTRHPRERAADLQTGSYGELVLVAYTSTITEKEVHRRLRSHRLRGEFFRVTPALLEMVHGWDWVDTDVLRQLREVI